MLVRTRAIVLRTKEYSDQSLICSMYTRDFGAKSFMVKGRESLPKLGFFQIGNILDIVCHLGRGELYTLDEFFLEHTCRGLDKNIKMRWLFLFTLEFLSSVFTSPDQDVDLYLFLEGEIKRFAQEDEERLEQIHLEIMRDLSEYIGIKPLLPEAQCDNFFQISSGTFVDSERLGVLNVTLSKIWLDFLKDGDKIKSDRKILDAESKKALLSLLINYYISHLEGFRVPKSYELLCDLI